MDLIDVLFGLSIIFGIFMSYGVGANNLANGIATLVGTKTYPQKKAIIIFIILSTLGAFFYGFQYLVDIVVQVIHPSSFVSETQFMIGLFVSLMIAAPVTFVAMYFSLPVSPVHILFASFLGVLFVQGGWYNTQWLFLLFILLSITIIPIIAGILCISVLYALERFILNKIHPRIFMEIRGPYFLLFSYTVFSLTAILAFSYISALPSLIILCLLALWFVSLIAFFFISQRFLARKSYKTTVNAHGTEKVFRPIHMTSTFLFSTFHGASDLCLSVAPLALFWSLNIEGYIVGEQRISAWIIVFCAIAMACGAYFSGERVLKTISFDITKMTNSRGFVVNSISAFLMLFFFLLGLPLSSTHTVIGSIAGIGFYDKKHYFWRETKKILLRYNLGWLIFMVLALLLTSFFYFIFDLIFI